MVRVKTISRAAALLAAHGGTQRAVAEAMNRDHAVVSRMLRGRQRPSPDLEAALVSLLGTEAAEDVLAAIPREPVAA